MSKRRRLLLAGTTGYACLLAISLIVGRSLAKYEAPCPGPCPDMGTEIETASPSDEKMPNNVPENFRSQYKELNDKVLKKYHAIYHPKCEPVKLSLELYKPEAQANKRYTLWYRVKLENVSCLNLSVRAEDFIRIPTFVDPKPNDWQMGLRLWNPQGAPLKSEGPPAPSTMFGKKTTEYGEVFPYEDDADAYQKIKSELKPDQYHFVDLKPGQSVSTLPSVLNPHVIEFRDVTDANGQGTDIVSIPAKFKGTPAPPVPQGYRILDQFVFMTPGTYRVQAYFGSQVTVTPLRPYRKAGALCFIPWLPITLLNRLVPFLPVDLIPLELNPKMDHITDRNYHVQAESEILEFTVKP